MGFLGLTDSPTLLLLLLCYGVGIQRILSYLVDPGREWERHRLGNGYKYNN